jgi:type IV pilus assembly protein PilP
MRIKISNSIYMLALLLFFPAGCKQNDDAVSTNNLNAKTAVRNPQQETVSSAGKTTTIQGRMSSNHANVPVMPRLSSSISLVSPGTFSMDFSGKRDPFIPLIVKEDESKINKNLPKAQQPGIVKYKVIGIMGSSQERSALILDANGKGYVVKQGMQIGTSDTYVVKITNSAVNVEERLMGEHGHIKKHKVILILLKKM